MNQKEIINAPKVSESLLYGVGYKPLSVGALYNLIMDEIWKGIKGFGNYYKISNFGKVLSLRTNKLLIPRSDKDGYLRVTLCGNGIKRFTGIHKLVAEAFILNPENKLQVNHIDFDPKNNYDSNLEWLTDKENKEHSIKNGRKLGRPRK